MYKENSAPMGFPFGMPPPHGVGCGLGLQRCTNSGKTGPPQSAPCSPVKSDTKRAPARPDAFHVIHKVPQGDGPYVRAKKVQLVDKDPDRAIVLFWKAINSGDRVDSALKDMAIVMKQQNRAEEAIEAIKSLRGRCSEHAQESLDNVLLDLYKRCGRLDDQIALLKHKLHLIHQGMAFNGKRTKTARSQGKKFQVSIEQEATRLLGNLGWAYMQQKNYIAAEAVYRKALSIEADNNKVCNLGICLMQQNRLVEARALLQTVTPVVGPLGADVSGSMTTMAGQSGIRWGCESHLKSFERAHEMLLELEAAAAGEGCTSSQLWSQHSPSMPPSRPGPPPFTSVNGGGGGAGVSRQQHLQGTLATIAAATAGFGAYPSTAAGPPLQTPVTQSVVRPRHQRALSWDGCSQVPQLRPIRTHAQQAHFGHFVGYTSDWELSSGEQTPRTPLDDLELDSGLSGEDAEVRGIECYQMEGGVNGTASQEVQHCTQALSMALQARLQHIQRMQRGQWGGGGVRTLDSGAVGRDGRELVPKSAFGNEEKPRAKKQQQSAASEQQRERVPLTCDLSNERAIPQAAARCGKGSLEKKLGLSAGAAPGGMEWLKVRGSHSLFMTAESGTLNRCDTKNPKAATKLEALKGYSDIDMACLGKMPGGVLGDLNGNSIDTPGSSGKRNRVPTPVKDGKSPIAWSSLGFTMSPERLDFDSSEGTAGATNQQAVVVAVKGEALASPLGMLVLQKEEAKFGQCMTPLDIKRQRRLRVFQQMTLLSPTS